MSYSQYPPQYGIPPAAPTPPQRPRSRRGLAIGLLGAAAGCAAGAVIATAVGANASTTATGTGAPAAVAASASAGTGHGYQTPPNTGTVTAVGSNSVTIKTSSGTTTYGVTSQSDIDKNGEAQLRDLKVGDAVRFSTMTVNGSTVIDKLHAGDEALDRPAGAPAGG